MVSSQPRVEPAPPALTARSFTTEPRGTPTTRGVDAATGSNQGDKRERRAVGGRATLDMLPERASLRM